MVELDQIAAFLRRSEEWVILKMIDEELFDEIGAVDNGLAQRFVCAELAGPKWSGGVCSPVWMAAYLAASVRWQRFTKKTGAGRLKKPCFRPDAG